MVCVWLFVFHGQGEYHVHLGACMLTVRAKLPASRYCCATPPTMSHLTTPLPT